MTIKGHVRDGRIELDEPTALPEGAQVTIEFNDASLSDDIAPEIRAVTGLLPRDLDAKEEYIRGQLKKHS